MAEIKGLEKFAPKDFPGHISSTVFLGGCNFRCPYCHNADLVLRPESLPSFPMDYFLCYLDSRKDWLEAVCISGGEPLMEEGVEDLLRVVKDRKLLVKIDTNGAFPDRLEGLIKNGLVDYAAMDVKAPIERYKEVTKVDVCTGDIRRSIEILRKSGLKTLFRTTVVPGLIGAEDVKKICRLLDGTPAFQIQQFSPRTTIDKRYLLIKPYSREDIEEMARHARPHFSEVRIEGV